jgi:FkbM family methyltransferase
LLLDFLQDHFNFEVVMGFVVPRERARVAVRDGKAPCSRTSACLVFTIAAGLWLAFYGLAESEQYVHLRVPGSSSPEGKPDSTSAVVSILRNVTTRDGSPESTLAAPDPFPGLAAAVPQLLPHLDHQLAAASCPLGSPDFPIAMHPTLRYKLVGYGPPDFISQVCVDAARDRTSLYFEEPASTFAVGLMRAEQGDTPTRPWMLDIGSNIGVFSVAAAAAGFPVIAIEATPGTAQRVNCAAAHNDAPHLAVINAAVVGPGAPRHVCIMRPDGPSNRGGNAVSAQASCGDSGEEVATLRIDSLPANLPAPTFLKLDVEGYELHMIRGGSEWLRSHQPMYVFMEVVPNR